MNRKRSDLYIVASATVKIPSELPKKRKKKAKRARSKGAFRQTVPANFGFLLLNYIKILIPVELTYCL